MIYEYSGLLLGGCVTVIIAVLLFLMSYLLIFREYTLEKLTAYECGFGCFDSSRSTFDVRFYLIGILFLVFDLEIIYLFPWCVLGSSMSFWSYWLGVCFIFILLVGFIYEWLKGSLDW